MLPGLLPGGIELHKVNKRTLKQSVIHENI